MPEPQSTIKPAQLFRAAAAAGTYCQRFIAPEANLLFLNCGEFELPPQAGPSCFSFPERESLLYQWKGTSTVQIDGAQYNLDEYDTLYIPRGAAFSIGNPTPAPSRLIHTSAPAENIHPVFHARFAEFSQREDRIRHLKGKDVYLMFDVSEGADKLVAGYTFFEPYARSWPPHNHTDQEEAYIFIKGKGSMEVYESPETLTFVHNVNEGDIVTIPILNYHPVFSQEEPLHFIWCIAGERYWIGDKNNDFMKGTAGSITT
jgi:mannose-6-phosphate isomerase-like protein (cupin superfamily)